MLERGNGVPSRARVLWANLSAQGARVRERWLTRPLAPCSQLKAHSREREIGSQDCYSNMVEQCLTMFCCETLEYDTFGRETLLKYDTFCRKNLDSALWAKKMANLRCEPTPHFMPLWSDQWGWSPKICMGYDHRYLEFIIGPMVVPAFSPSPTFRSSTALRNLLVDSKSKIKF